MAMNGFIACIRRCGANFYKARFQKSTIIVYVHCSSAMLLQTSLRIPSTRLAFHIHTHQLAQKRIPIILHTF
eukprot:4296768-Amphidinium_carterae.2